MMQYVLCRRTIFTACLGSLDYGQGSCVPKPRHGFVRSALHHSGPLGSDWMHIEHLRAFYYVVTVLGTTTAPASGDGVICAENCLGVQRYDKHGVGSSWS